jgi:hypothetical protein
VSLYFATLFSYSNLSPLLSMGNGQITNRAKSRTGLRHHTEFAAESKGGATNPNLRKGRGRNIIMSSDDESLPRKILQKYP